MTSSLAKTSESRPKKRHILSLTSTRGFAAYLVVIYHYAQGLWPFSYLPNQVAMGYLAVSYFFVLSGYVMVLSYNDVPDFSPFFRRRMARIYPAYLLSMLLALLIPLSDYIRHGHSVDGDLGIQCSLFLTFLQPLFPGYALALNGPGWSLSVEMFFYILFPLLLRLAREHGKWFWSGTLFCFILTQACAVWLSGEHFQIYSHQVEFVSYHPIFHLNEFLLGMLGAMSSSKQRMHSRFLAQPLVPTLLLLAVTQLTSPHQVGLHVGLAAPLFLWLIRNLTIYPPVFLESKTLVYFGEISYGIYILQDPIYRLVFRCNDLSFKIGGLAFFAVYSALLVLGASLSYHLIEQPGRNFILRTFGKNGKKLDGPR